MLLFWREDKQNNKRIKNEKKNNCHTIVNKIIIRQILVRCLCDQILCFILKGKYHRVIDVYTGYVLLYTAEAFHKVHNNRNVILQIVGFVAECMCRQLTNPVIESFVFL